MRHERRALLSLAFCLVLVFTACVMLLSADASDEAVARTLRPADAPRMSARQTSATLQRQGQPRSTPVRFAARQNDYYDADGMLVAFRDLEFIVTLSGISAEQVWEVGSFRVVELNDAGTELDRYIEFGGPGFSRTVFRSDDGDEVVSCMYNQTGIVGGEEVHVSVIVLLHEIAPDDGHGGDDEHASQEGHASESSAHGSDASAAHGSSESGSAAHEKQHWMRPTANSAPHNHKRVVLRNSDLHEPDAELEMVLDIPSWPFAADSHSLQFQYVVQALIEGEGDLLDTELRETADGFVYGIDFGGFEKYDLYYSFTYPLVVGAEDEHENSHTNEPDDANVAIDLLEQAGTVHVTFDNFSHDHLEYSFVSVLDLIGSKAHANVAAVVSFSVAMIILLFGILLAGFISQKMSSKKAVHH